LFHPVFESHDGRPLGAESEEKREPVSDIDTALVDSLKVLDPDGRLEKPTSSHSRRQLFANAAIAVSKLAGESLQPFPALIPGIAVQRIHTRARATSSKASGMRPR
jgi:hypothetical protein